MAQNMTDMQFTTYIERGIKHAFETRAAEICEEEIATAQANIEKRLNDEVNRIALAAFAAVDISQDATRLIITLKKDMGNG